MSGEHLPVLLGEAIAGLQIRPGGRYIDATVGAGGHADAILRASAPDGKLLGLDADPHAISFAAQALRWSGQRTTLVRASFRHLFKVAADAGFLEVDGVLFDLGLSSCQLADGSRGFAFRLDGPLDMRFDPSQGRTAGELVNTLPEGELADILFQFGQERQARRIAHSIVAARPLQTTQQLAELVARAVGRRGKINPATRTFQALRMAVNAELEALGLALPQARDLLRPGARLGVISFHSLEDGLTKRFFQQEAKGCICPPEVLICRCDHQATLRLITRKPICPSPEEMALNPRSRSARLRLVERLGPPAAEAVRPEGLSTPQ